MSRLHEIESELYDQLGAESNPSPRFIQKVRRDINTVYRELMGRKGLGVFRHYVLPFSSVANVEFAVLPMAASRIIAIHDRTNDWNLDPMPIQDLRYHDPGLSSSASYPYAYVLLNLAAAVARDPSAAAEIFIDSTNAGDTADAYIQAIRTGGYPRSMDITMTGTSAVSFDPTITDITNILKFYLSAPAVGDVTLHEGSGGGTELARIPAGRTSARYTRIQLHPTPSVATSYYADVEVALLDLANPNDEPLFHEDWHWLISCGALMREYARKKDHMSYAQEKSRWKDGVAELILFASRIGGVTMDERGGRRFSHLGPYYPVGS